MSAKRAISLVMAKMALADGEVVGEEREFLKPMLDSDESLDDMLAEARSKSLAELVAPVQTYADKFFIAMRAAAMSRIDADFDAREEALYERLLALLKLEQSDQELIERSLEAMDQVVPTEPEPRIEELYMQSSFAQ